MDATLEIVLHKSIVAFIASAGMQGKRLVFVTNNSTKSRKQYGKKFESLGLSVSEVEAYALMIFVHDDLFNYFYCSSCCLIVC